MIGEVLSVLPPKSQAFRLVVYEWEDDLARYFDVKVRKVPFDIEAKVIKGRLRRFVVLLLNAMPKPIRSLVMHNTISQFTQSLDAPLSVFFLMLPREMNAFIGSNCLPIFLDTFSDWNIKQVLELTNGFNLFYVTSRDVYNKIKAVSPSSNVHYMPLSIADKWHSENFAAYRHKHIDVCMPGRGNPVLHQYMLRYVDEHRGIKYVYKHPNLEYKSKDGSISLPAATREEYMNVIASSKVSIVGCSGIDNARDYSNGICLVTPRFYESAILGCALIGRYPDNQEFTELNMRQVCPNITSYEQFTRELERALAQTPEELYAQNRDFIINSLTSKRAEQIQHDLEALTCTNS